MPKIEKVHIPMDRDKALERAEFLINNGYVQNKTVEQVIAELMKPEEDRPKDMFDDIFTSNDPN